MNLERPIAPDPYSLLPAVEPFNVTSSDITDGAALPDVHSFGGGNRSPHLAWSGFPSATRSFAVTCFDPDAPTASGFWHWLVVDIPSDVTEFAQGAGADDGSLPGGFHIPTDFRTANYGGAAPPPGDHPHRYMFAVHAVDTESLGLDPGVSPAQVGFTLTFHTLARARITATYHR